MDGRSLKQVRVEPVDVGVGAGPGVGSGGGGGGAEGVLVMRAAELGTE